MNTHHCPTNRLDAKSIEQGLLPYAPARPNDVLNDRSLTHAEKRAELASWASDARAPEDHPALRILDDGSVIFLEDVLKALRKLDDQDDDPPPAPAGMRASAGNDLLAA